jgi:ABC-type oligopeptide transport system substrate-binding subunit
MISLLLGLWIYVHATNNIVVGVPGAFTSVDPIQTVTAQNRYALQLIYENLIKVNLQQELEPMLAKKWRIDYDRYEIEFELKEDHLFSNGDAVTAKDVASSFKEVCSKSSKARAELSGLKGCSNEKNNGVEILSKYKFRLHSQIHPSALLHQLTNLRVVVFKRSGKQLYGSGPYRLQELNEKTLKLLPNKYSPLAKSLKNPGLTFAFYDDENSLMRALADNNIHSSFVQLSRHQDLEFNSNFKRVDDLPYLSQMLVFNTQRYPFDSKDLRKSILNQVEKNSERLSICRAIGSKPAYGLIPVGLGGSIAQTKTENDLQKITKLKEATTVTIHQHKGRENTCEAEILKEIMKAHNITMNMEYHKTYDTLWPLYLNHNLDGFIELFNYKNREAYSILSYFTTKGNNENYANLNDLQLDNLILEALKGSTLHDRFSWYRKANQHIRENAYVAPMYYTATKNYYHQCLIGSYHTPSFNPYPQLANISAHKCSRIDR